MFKELDEYFKAEMLDDYWYDEALHICQEILKGFSDKEWTEVLKAIPVESTGWRMRLVECLGELKNPYEIECIVQALEVDDNEDLFVACIDSLRFIEFSTLPESHKENVEKRVRGIIEAGEQFLKPILEDYLKKHS